MQKHKSDGQAIQKVRNPIRTAYGNMCSKLANVVDIAQGFYLWGRYDRKRYWHSCYLGKAGFGKATNLQARISEEMKDEQWFIWRHVHSKERVLQICETVYPTPRHRQFCERSMRKAGATHIIWVPATSIPPATTTRIEADLIEALNPEANIVRPTPPNAVQASATDIFQAFRRTIHAARETAFLADLSN